MSFSARARLWGKAGASVAVAMVMLFYSSVAFALDDLTQGLLFPMYGENAPICGTGSRGLEGGDTQAKIFNYFLARGLTPYQAAGFMGNIQVESQFQIDNQENSKPWGTGGWGLVQWTSIRREAIAKEMVRQGIGDLYNPDYADGKTPPERHDELLMFELEYIWTELQTTHKKALAALTAATNYIEATYAILSEFEKPGGSWDRALLERAPLSKAILDKYGSDTPPETSAPEASNVLIALDPGHGAIIPQHIDGPTGLADRETNNQPEGDDVLAVSQRVKAELEKVGYRVILLRSYSGEAVTKRQRVDKAVAEKASLVVSIHTDPGGLNQVWPQRAGTYREYNGKRVTITNSEVASKSQTYADNIAVARQAAEGHPVGLDPSNSQQAASFSREGVPSKGNVSLVQLWGQNVPWVYNEISQDSPGGGISEALKQKYTTGIVEGIKKGLPPGGYGEEDCIGGGAVTGSWDGKLLEYAWPTYKGNTVVPTAGWAALIKRAPGMGRYIGGIRYKGIDCGGFVTSLVLDTGYDPGYNYGGLLKNGAGATPTQYSWLRNNWQSLGKGGDPARLRSGDVAIRNGHTFIFVGDVPGFGSKIASASLDTRAPMADTQQSASDPTFEWFRKKGNDGLKPI